MIICRVRRGSKEIRDSWLMFIVKRFFVCFVLMFLSFTGELLKIYFFLLDSDNDSLHNCGLCEINCIQLQEISD